MTNLEIVLSIATGWMVVSAFVGLVIGKVIRAGVGPEPLPSEGERLFARARRVRGSFSPVWHGGV